MVPPGPRGLPLLCASNEDTKRGFHASGCRGRACDAGHELAEMHAGNFTPARDAALPACPIADRCAWDVGARDRGEPGCTVRRLGMLCEHQGGEWSTWMMADPDDPCWREHA